MGTPLQGGKKKLRLKEKTGQFGSTGGESTGKSPELPVYTQPRRLRHPPPLCPFPQEAGQTESQMVEILLCLSSQQGALPGQAPEGAGQTGMEKSLGITVAVGRRKGSETNGQRGHA